MSLRLLLTVLVGLAVTIPVTAEEAPTKKPGSLVFEKDIFPILKAKCSQCHFGEKPKGGLNLERRATIIRGGQNGPAIRISAAETSLLFEVLSSDRMPLQGPKLTQEEKGLIRTWINEGAPTDSKEVLEVAEAKSTYDASEYEYWSFFPPERPALPIVKHVGQVSNPVDAFLLSKLEEKELVFSAPASRVTLVRRLYLDLLGILPLPSEVAEFVADPAPDAYEQLVDRLLASPRYGERWGRHWLDVAGYSDSAGVLSADQDRQLIWRYRDYVIKAFNKDLPYDQFVREQLAGDELSEYWKHYKNDDALPADVVNAMEATGFLRTGPDSSRPDFNTIKNVNGLYYYPTIDSQLAILTSSLMGITVKCAKCHNHKFDPLTQKNYYQLQSILMTVYSPEQWVPFRDRKRPIASKKQEEAAAARKKEVDANVAALKKEIVDLQKAQAEKLYQHRLETVSPQIRDDLLAALAVAADKRNAVQNYLVGKFATFLRPAADKLEAEIASVFPEYKQTVAEKNAAIAAQEKRRMHFDYVYAAYDVKNDPFTPLLRRGDAQTPGPVVTPGVPEMIKARQPFDWKPPATGSPTSGRRTALADWLTQPRHPLTARVMANRLWLHHFGEGLVSTMEDFGWAGEDPIHLDLLDWLAVELESANWSLKHLHRLMLTSTAYRQMSRNEGELANRADQVDSQNRLLWRQNLRRLEAEPLRDSILEVSGGLQSHMYGYPVGIASRSDGEVVVNDGKLPQKRSIYLRSKRSAPVSLLQLFDQPDLETNCTRRSQSTVPLQALSLMNSDLVSNSAIAFAERVLHESSEDPLGRAFELAYSRPPAAAERKTLEAFTQKQQALHLATSGGKKVWAYGYGTIDGKDPRKVAYTAFPTYEKAQWQLGPGYPFMGSYWAGINATGGHPGAGKPVILKWTSPVTGKVRLEGMVHHPSPAGNGVRTTIASDQQGQLGQWAVAHKREEVSLEVMDVKQGEQWFIVLDMNGELTSDNFKWSFTIKEVDQDGQLMQTWDSVSGFHGPLNENGENQENARKQSIVDLCHVLLSSNEFAYVD